MARLTKVPQSRVKAGSYAPQFDLRFDGVPVDPQVLRDVRRVQYHDAIGELDGFELTVENWDPVAMQPRYVGPKAGADSPAGGQGILGYGFGPFGQRVELRMGYAGDLRLMLVGEATTLEQSFPRNGHPALILRGVNVLHQLRRGKYSSTWFGKRESEIARDIASHSEGSAAASGIQPFPLPVVVDPGAMKAEEPVDIVVQRDQHGIDFLASRARRLGYIVALREGNPGAKTAAERVPHVYFGPSHGRAARASTESIELTWGSSLIEFSSRISSSTQVKSVTVNGVRLARGKPVTATATLGDLGIPLTPSARRMSASWDSAESVAIDAPVRTQRDATRLAKAILGDRIKDIETASGICVGLPDLRAGKRVVIEGVGKPFGGSSLVTNSTHTIDESGYETSFSVRREQKGDLIRTR